MNGPSLKLYERFTATAQNKHIGMVSVTADSREEAGWTCRLLANKLVEGTRHPQPFVRISSMVRSAADVHMKTNIPVSRSPLKVKKGRRK